MNASFGAAEAGHVQRRQEVVSLAGGAAGAGGQAARALCGAVWRHEAPGAARLRARRGR